MARKQGVVFSYLYMLFEILSSVLFTPFLIRRLGQSEYAVYSLVATVTAYLLLLDLGTGNAIVRYMAKFRALDDRAQMRKFLGISIIFYGIIAAAVIAAGLAIRNNIAVFFSKGLTAAELEQAKAMFSVTMINAALTLFIAAFIKTVIAFEKFALSKSLDILRIIFRVGLSVICLLRGFGGLGVVTVNLVLTIVFGLIYIIYVFRRLRITPVIRGLEFGFVREIVGYSFFIFLQMIAAQVNSMADQVLIGALVTASSGILAVYAAGAQITQYFQSIAGSINGVLMPGVVRMVEGGASPRQLQEEMVRIGRMVLIILGLIYTVFLVNGRVFMELWAGKPNIDGYWVAVIIMLPMIFYLVQSIGSQILWAMGRHKVQAVLQILVAAGNILLTVVLIRWNPLIGASVGTAASMLAGNVIVMNIVFVRDIHISLGAYYRELLRGILPSLIITGIFGFCIACIPIPEPYGFLINCCCMAAVYGGLLFRFGANSDEKQLAAAIFQKFRKSKR